MLTINIPNPCSQNFETMPDAGNGKYCSECKNIVYDFSQMDDDELLRFFNQRSKNLCGRFHNSQLQRVISPAQKPYRILLSKFNKVAAAFFTVLSFRGMSSNAEIKKVNSITVFDSNYKHKSRSDSGMIVISGIIKDADGKPLEKAIVQFDSVQMTTTDKEGRFRFELEKVNNTNHNIYFSYDSMVTIMRSYHPKMLSSNYEVSLYKKSTATGNGYFLMGEPVAPPLIQDLPTIKFNQKSLKLSDSAMSLLSEVAAKLKANPTTLIIVTAYSKADIKSQIMCENRTKNIKKYLVEKEGIDPDRIYTNSEFNGGDINAIDIKQKFY